MTVQDGDILALNAWFATGVSDMTCAFHVEVSVSSPVADAQALIDAAGWLDDCWANIVALLGTQMAFTTIGMRNVTQITPTQYADWPTLTAGTRDNPLLPLQCAVLAVFPTGASKTSGRKYIPGFTNQSNEGQGEVEDLDFPSLALWANDVLDGYPTGDGIARAGAWSPSKIRFSPFTSVYFDDLFRTQRRRVLGVGT